MNLTSKPPLLYFSRKPSPHDELTKLSYIQWDNRYKIEKPYQIVSENIPELDAVGRSNITMAEGPPEVIIDVRGQEGKFNLDDHGFEFKRHSFPDINYQDRDQVERLYKPEIEALLKESVTGVDEVYFFNWRLRLNVAKDGLANLNNPCVPLVPAHNVHLDQSPATAIQYVYECMGSRAAKYLKCRVRIFNIWRPYAHPVSDCPLALSDGSTIDQQDMLVCDNIQRTRLGETMLPLYNPNVKWYYLSNQMNDEVTIIKIFDSLETVKAPSCPHSAFYHSEIPEGAKPRESIEVRALIFTYPPGGARDFEFSV